MLHLQARRARGNDRLDKNPSLSRDLWLASRFRDRDFIVGYFFRRLSDPVRCLIDVTQPSSRPLSLTRRSVLLLRDLALRLFYSSFSTLP